METTTLYYTTVNIYGEFPAMHHVRQTALWSFLMDDHSIGTRTGIASSTQ